MKRGKLLALIVATSLALIAALIATRVAQKSKPQAAQTPAAASVLELAPTDIVAVAPVDMVMGLPISGTLRAVNFALVKARVAGELQGLKVREGDSVKAGQVLAQIDPTEYKARLQQAQQQADSAKAQLDITQRQLDNNKALVAQNFISQTALEASLSNLQAAQANHRAALAAADVARKSLDETTLLAPITGHVAQRLAQPGERLAVDARILEIVDIARLELEASVAAADSTQLKLGQTAQLKLEGSEQVVKARLVRINPSAQAATRTVVAYLSIDNKSGDKLRQGMFAQGNLGTGSSRLLAVPVSAVRTDQAQPYVQVLHDGKVVQQPIRTGLQGTVGDELMVQVDLPEGAAVLRASVGSLRSGQPARVTAMPASAGSKP